ncbi:retrovirus-related pol polyprotein from transposon TNT 1-94 [Tanacetum coccineum]
MFSPSTDTTVPSQQELDLLFGPLYDEFFNDDTSRVNKSSSPTDNFAPQDTHPSMNIHPTSEPTTQTNVHAEGNNIITAEFTNLSVQPGQLQIPQCKRNCQFDRLQVWELVDKPFGKNVIKLKWLWKNKKDEDQTVIRNKARLVAKGYAQKRVLISHNHLLPVLAWRLFRIFVAMLHTIIFTNLSMDVKMAFLNGPLKEEVYVATTNDSLILSSRLSLTVKEKTQMELKQAPRAG